MSIFTAAAAGALAAYFLDAQQGAQCRAVRDKASSRKLPVALFGASTGAAPALIAAAERPRIVRAVVSRGGRPDLAGGALARVQAPTLLIVGGSDDVVLDVNRDAMRHMQSRVNLEIVPGATHLFEEPGALEKAAQLSADWCERYLLHETT
jgi:putative phosphoribosyl transferase